MSFANNVFLPFLVAMFSSPCCITSPAASLARCLSGWSLCHVAVQFMYSLHTIMMTDFILGSQALEVPERDTTTRHYNLQHDTTT